MNQPVIGDDSYSDDYQPRGTNFVLNYAELNEG